MLESIAYAAHNEEPEQAESKCYKWKVVVFILQIALVKGENLLITGIEPKVHSDASVRPASVIMRVSPSCSAVRILGASKMILNAPIANPIIITMEDLILCF